MRKALEPVSVHEALRKNEIRIEVPPQEIRTVGPFEERYAEAFRVAEVKSFEDLQVLGMIPRELTEPRALDAIRADDAAFRDRHRELQRELRDCDCQEHSSANVTSFRRSRIQSSLATLLPDHFRSRLDLDEVNPGILHVYGHLSRSSTSTPPRRPAPRPNACGGWPRASD